MRRVPASTSQLFLLSLLLSACTTPADPRDAASDSATTDLAIVDDAGPCPATPPATASGCRVDGLTCEYETQRCRCRSPQWYCESIECPATPPTNGQSCTQVGQVCNPSFENQCLCVGPEMIWSCCGYGSICPSLDEGDRCCMTYGNLFPCSIVDGGVQQVFACLEGHWRSRSTPIDAGADASGDDVTDANDASEMDASVE